MRLKLLDVAISIWVVFVGAAFVLSAMFGGAWAELALVARYVYSVVFAAGLVGLAIRLVRMLGRQNSHE